MRSWFIAFTATVLCALSLGLFAAPAGATESSNTAVADNSSGLATGGTLTFTATVSGAGVTPTGSVTWTVTDPNGAGVACPPSTLDGSGEGTCTVTDVIAGTYSATADYGGDTTYDGSSGQDTTASIAKATSATTVADDSSGVATGGSFSFTATVSGPGVTPTGSVTWTVTDPNGAGVACPPSTLDGSGEGTCTVTDAIAGTYSAIAGYTNGDANYTGSSGDDTTASVGKATSATAVADDSSGVATGGDFSFTATVTGAGVTPSGTVTWTVNGPAGSVPCPPSTLDGSGEGTCTVTDVIAGTYSATADYGGDPNYGTSSDQDSTASISKATAGITVNDNAAGVATGGSFSFTATVSGPGVTPTGSVTWTVTDPNGAGVACPPSTLDGSGEGTCTVTDAIAGTYSATADYGGDTNYDSGSGQDTTASIAKAGSNTAVIDDSPGVATGGMFSFTATVSGVGQTPTGTVSWTVTDPNGQAVVCASSALNGSGQGTCTVTDVLAGTYSATADYSGDTNYDTSSGHDTTASVVKAASSTGVTDTAAGVVTGGTFAFSATVTGPGVTPTGTIIWTVSGPTGPVSCAPSTLDDNGEGTCTITHAMAGDYSAKADYGGDPNYDTSSAQDTTAHIGIAAQTILFTSVAPNAIFAGPQYNATAQSTSELPVTITSSTTDVCSISSGQVSFDGVGTCTLNANQEGDAYWSEAVQVTQTFQVNRATPSSPLIINIPTDATEFGTYVASVFTSGDGATSVSSISTAVCTLGADGHTITFVGFGVCTLTANVAQGTNYLSGTGGTQSFPVNPAARGYWLVGSDGGIFSFGAAAFYGSMGGTPLQRPVVGITPSASRTGYWLVASDGGIFSFGNSSYYGSIPGVGLHPAGSGLPNSLNAPIVGMVPSVTGHGYFMVASDGGVFAFGDAHFAGSCPGIGGCAGSAVSVMPDSTGKGYWLVTNVGAVYAFGDAQFYGAPPAQSVPVVDAVPTPDWRGYWLLYANGVVAGFGDASTQGAPLGYVNGFNPASAIFPTADGKGYWVASGRGDVFAYGDAPYLGSEAAAGLNGEIIAAFGF
jgi:large repetitive protein